MDFDEYQERAAKYDCFEKLKEQGINVIDFPSQTAKAFERGKNDE